MRTQPCRPGREPRATSEDGGANPIRVQIGLKRHVEATDGTKLRYMLCNRMVDVHRGSEHQEGRPGKTLATASQWNVTRCEQQ